MKRMVVLLALALGACEPQAGSDAPLLTAGGAAPRAGLWAMLQAGCQAPTTVKVQDWPACAAPLWVTPERATFMMPGPVASEYVLAEGAPRLAQLRASHHERDEDAPAYVYFAVAPEGAGAFAKARIWAVPCPRDADGVAQCRLETAGQLRELAARPAEDVRTAVWVTEVP